MPVTLITEVRVGTDPIIRFAHTEKSMFRTCCFACYAPIPAGGTVHVYESTLNHVNIGDCCKRAVDSALDVKDTVENRYGFHQGQYFDKDDPEDTVRNSYIASQYRGIKAIGLV